MIDSSCCGMAGSFGYDSKTYETSKKMANLSLIPAINGSNENDFIVANGTSGIKFLIYQKKRNMFRNYYLRFLKL